MKIIPFTVKANLPEKLMPLQELAYNLWISWNFEAIRLFIRLDYDAWLASRQNPAKTLGLVTQERLEEAAADDSYIAALERVYSRFRSYLDAERWYNGDMSRTIAYFSMEYGLDTQLPIYSGGLGVLSGDHLKTSSDLGLPLVGVGLLYRQGYFRQYLNPDGFQLETYPENDWYNMPVNIGVDKDGEPVKISVDIGREHVIAQVWEVKIGRSSLYLLDTNIDENSPDNRLITATLYGGDREMRLRQEILLGIGGIRALFAMGITPAVAHMNEGHSAFLGLERIRRLVADRGLTFKQALQAVKPTNIFTTHTPVPAGNERFAVDLMAKYFKKMAAELNIEWQNFLALGRENPADSGESFCMTVLALKLSTYANGVSSLHGKVSKKMWRKLWPGLPVEEVPIIAITNGVHPRTWISHDMLDLLDRYFGPAFNEKPMELDIWKRMERISDEELFRTHERRRERLVVFTRHRLKAQLEGRGNSTAQIEAVEGALSPYALTISFARRFATYKRANLLLKSPERLIKLLSDNEQPIQLIFAGKAHPHDLEGKELIKEIIHFTGKPEVRSRIIFLEDYDMTIARYLVSGSDLWLNTPLRPMEASGTSGMKAAFNSVLNLSVLDGWWAEAFSPDCGWAIGQGEEYENKALQDEIEGKALYDLLEREIIPMFYNRGRDGLPREWIKRMKNSMSMAGRGFSSHRMLMEYSDKFYLPALANYEAFSGKGFTRAKEVAEYIDRVQSHWGIIKVEHSRVTGDRRRRIGEKLKVTAMVDLGPLSADDVLVELYFGPLSPGGEISRARRMGMKLSQSDKLDKGGTLIYETEIPCDYVGRQGYAVRVLPRHPFLVEPFPPGLLKWG